jgi:hypothetical protein
MEASPTTTSCLSRAKIIALKDNLTQRQEREREREREGGGGGGGD